MKLTAEQECILTEFSESNDSFAVSAMAGSGKSFIIKKGISTQFGKRCVLLAFNKAIADAIRPEVPQFVEVKTFNAWGYAICKQNIRGFIKIDKDKTAKLAYNYLVTGLGTPKPLFFKVRNQIAQWVSWCKATLIDPVITPEILDDLEIYEQDARNLVMMHFEAIFNQCVNNFSLLDFDDQIYYPVRYNWRLPEADVMCIDEAQDLSPMQIELVKRMMEKGTRIIPVGDPNQAIYAFRGADVHSMPKLIQLIGSKKYSLSTCFRCPKAVIKHAQEIVPEITYLETADEGEVKTLNFEDFYKQHFHRNDIVVCRVNRPLVSICLNLIKRNIPAYVKGRELKEALLQMIRDVQRDRVISLELLLDGLEEAYNEKMERYEKRKQDAKMEQLEDMYSSLLFVAESCKTVADLFARIEDVFCENNPNAVVLMSIHKSKGLEATRVFYVKHTMKRKLDEEELLVEKNLDYVARTRAMSELVYVCD